MTSKAESTTSVEDLSFEKAFGELEETVQRLEEGDLTLEEAIALYEWGMALARRCGHSLDTAELQIRKLAVVNDQQQLGMFFDGETE